MRLPDAEEPVLDLFERVKFDEVRVVELLRDFELVPGLLEELLVLGPVEQDDFQGVLLAVGLAADVEDGTVRPLAKRGEHLELADLIDRSHRNVSGRRACERNGGMIAESTGSWGGKARRAGLRKRP